MAKEKQKTSAPVQYYEGLIAAYERAFKPWETRAEKVVQRYRDEQARAANGSQTKFNILWSNVNTLVPSCYSRLPQPDVGRRFRDQDPVGRVASLILERALTFEIEHYPDYRATMREAVQDRFLPGRGVAWARYEPHFKAAASQLPSDGLQVTEDEDAPKEQIDYECAPVDYVAWRDFGHNVARTWEEVFVVWRVVYMHEEGVVERFGKAIAAKLPYDATPEDKRKELTQQEVKKQARIYEIWDLQKKRAFWMSRSQPGLLDERDDPLGLAEFFPCPRPLYATSTNETLIPVPDFALYQDQARELDTIADRINGLVEMLQVKGVYDAAVPVLERIFTEGANGKLLPVKNWAAFAEKKGLAGAIDVLDLKPIYEALKVCFEAAREIINFIYQITGISDIVRGQTEASETLGAQQLKVNFVGLRLGDMKRDVARFATDLLQLKAQIMCQHFTPQTIMAMAAVEQLSPADQQHVFEMAPPGNDPMSGAPLPPQPVMGEDGKPLPGAAMLLLLGEARIADPEADSPNPLRAFRIEVNADSLVQLDDQAEKEAAKEMLGGIAKFLETAAVVVAGAPQMLPVMLELMKWALTKYKVGKNIEGTIDQALEQMKQAAMQPPAPDPAVAAEQAKADAAKQKAQLDVGVAQQKAQIEQQHMAAEQQHDRAKLGMEGQQLQMDGQRMAMEGQNQQQQMMMKNQQMQAQHAQKMQMAKMPPKRPQ